jgi:hypothetical protein
MAQDLTVNIKTTSDVPQAMDKAKAATVSFGKQVEDVQKKFSMAFKDIFLSFLGPMALVGVAVNYIGGLIADNQKKQADANQAAIDGTNELMSAEDKYWARKKDREKKTKETKEQSETERIAVTKEFLLKDPRGQAIFSDAYGEGKIGMMHWGGLIGDASRNKDLQAQVQSFLAEDIKNNGMILTEEEKASLQKIATEKAAAQSAQDAKDLQGLKQLAASSKPGEIQGYGNVIGVGSNIAIEMAQMQIDELKRHTELLQMIATKEQAASLDFSKGDKSVAAPSRAKLLSGK